VQLCEKERKMHSRSKKKKKAAEAMGDAFGFCGSVWLLCRQRTVYFRATYACTFDQINTQNVSKYDEGFERSAKKLNFT
jgi:hypothetical protein